jgi:putative transposase
MNQLFAALGTSKQAFHQKMDRRLLLLEEQHQLLPVIEQLREDHPRMSARQLYQLVHPQRMGRDRFIQFCYSHGLKLEQNRSFMRTTNSLGVTRFENLIEGMELTAVNRVWSSDITYLRVTDRFYYLTFILDLFSRYIVGYSASESLLTEHTTLAALKMAITLRDPQPGLILHSDGGGQYYSKKFLALTRSRGMNNSMGKSVYENAHAERINGTIKNEYLIAYHPTDFNSLKALCIITTDLTKPCQD